jgi:hypothetical protein
VSTEVKKYEWSEQVYVIVENSYGIVDATLSPIDCTFCISIDEEEERGWFEWYDNDTGGVEYHCEGGLWFDGKMLTDYDGVFDLCAEIKNKLVELGYNLDEI